LIGWLVFLAAPLQPAIFHTMASANVPTQEFWFVTIPNDGSQSQSTFRKLSAAVTTNGLASEILHILLGVMNILTLSSSTMFSFAFPRNVFNFGSPYE
jgi:hypothetical protein